MFDPQTAGGLLAGVPAQKAESCVRALKELGYTETAIVGRVHERSDQAEPIALV
jgi:selenide,water dikinase